MWSYYSEEHKGYCFEYDASDIIKKIENMEIKGLCVFGDVSYKEKRPDQKSERSKFSFTDLKFYIDAVFTKYVEWKHEEESRFVIISEIIDLSQEFITISTDIKQIYKGCIGEDLPIHNSVKEILTTVRLVKDDSKYIVKKSFNKELI